MAAQSIKIPVELELKNMQSAINTLKQALSGISKESGLYSGLSKELTQVEKKFKELESVASRPFSNIASINSFERQFLKLGDRVVNAGKAFQELNFSDLDLSAIPGAQEQFENLKNAVSEAQERLNSINTNQMKNSLNDTSSTLSEVFEKIKSLGGEKLIDGSSFDNTFDNLKEKAKGLSTEIQKVEKDITRLQGDMSNKSTKIGFLDQALEKVEEFTKSGNLTRNNFANMLTPIAEQAGLKLETPEAFLGFLGLSNENLYIGAASKIKDNLTKAISKQKGSLSGSQIQEQLNIKGLENKLLQLQNYSQAVIDAKNALDALRTSSSTQQEVSKASDDFEKASKNLNDFVAACLKTNSSSAQAGNAVGLAGNAMNGFSSKASQATGELSRLNDAANKLSELKSRLAYFFSFYKVMNTVGNVVREATTTIKELDKVMTEISVVTQMTQKDLWAQIDTYSKIANEYSVTIKGVYEVSQLFYQQGHDKKFFPENLTFSKIVI